MQLFVWLIAIVLTIKGFFYMWSVSALAALLLFFIPPSLLLCGIVSLF